MATEKGMLVEHLDVCWINFSRRSFSMLGYVDSIERRRRRWSGRWGCSHLSTLGKHGKFPQGFHSVKELEIPRNVNEFNIVLTLKSLVSLHKTPNRIFAVRDPIDAKWMQFEDESARKSFITDNGVMLDWRIFSDAEKLCHMMNVPSREQWSLLCLG